MNLFDVEDAWMQGSVQFDQTMREFEAEFYRPLIETALATDMWVNQDIYLGGLENGKASILPGTETEEGSVQLNLQPGSGQPDD